MVKSLRQQKAEAARLGIIVRRVPRTGEIKFIDPFGEEPPIKVNHRRKDGTREVQKLIDKRMKGSNDMNDNDKGQGLVEYALILGLVAIVAIVALILLGGQVSAMLSKVGTTL